MNSPLRIFALFGLLIIAFAQAPSQRIGSIEPALPLMWVKAENGLILAWEKSNSRDSRINGITIFDKQGRRLVSLDVLRLVPDAESVSIWDVSARLNELIAVSATYIKPQEQAPVLLYFNPDGSLISAYALAPSREIGWLAIDDHTNVWTLTIGSNENSNAHLVVEYDKAGNVVRELLDRRLFPPHQDRIQQNSEVGAVAAGYDSGTFWFWLPSSTDLVTIRTRDGVVSSRVATGYPAVKDHSVWPLLITRESSGALLAEVRVEESGTTPAAPVLAYYAWSPSAKSWSSFHPDSCNGHRLVGVDRNEQIFFQSGAVSNICSYSR